MTKFSRWAKGLLVLLLLCLPLSRMMATTYYVKPGGNNNLDGRSWANAWAHPNKTNSNMGAGDTCFFAPGEYDTVLIVLKQGTFATPTVYACSASVAGRGKVIWHGGLPVTSSWTLSSGQVYYTTSTAGTSGTRWVNTPEIYNQNVCAYQRITGTVDSLLLPMSAIPTAAGRMFYDRANTRLYVWCIGGGNPGTKIRYSTKPVVLANSEAQDHNRFIGIDMRGGYQGVVILGHGGSDMSSAGGGGDSNLFIACNIGIGIETQSNNPAAIYHGNTYGAAKSSWAQFNEVRSCSLTQIRGINGGGGLHAGFGIELYASDHWKIDSNVIVDCGGGIGLKMGNYTDYGFSADSTFIRFNVMDCAKIGSIGESANGIWIGNKNKFLDISGNVIAHMNIGITMLTSSNTDPIEGSLRIWNNTIVNCNESMVQFSAQNAGCCDYFKYNVVFDTTGSRGYGDMVFRRTGDGINANESPPTERYWSDTLSGVIDSNLYWFSSGNSFTCLFHSNSGFSGTNWAAWRTAGFDSNSTINVNPGFAASHLGNYSRPGAANEMNVAHSGRTWTVYGAWQPAASHSSKWHDIDQIWHDAHDGLVNAAHGFAAGDTLNFIENVYCRNKKWGLVVQVPVLILGNGYALHPDSVALNTIANNSFETPDVDPTRAASWDFTDAPNISRMFGHYHVVTELTDEPSLWDGDYALRVQLPCATQTVKTTSSYQFAPKTHHAIEFAYLNVADANVRVTVGLLNANGDTAYSAKNNVGTMERGSEPVWVHFMTKDTVETYKIFIQITGGDAAASSNQVFFDHVLHTTFRNFGIALEPDTCTLDLDWMDNQRFYNPATGLMETDPGLCFSSTASNREFWGLGVQGGVAEGTVIRDLRIEPVQPSLFFRGIYGAYGCSDITIKKATIKPMGSNPMGVMTWNGVRWEIDSTDVIFPEEPLDYHYSKRESVPSVGFNLRADKNNYGYSSKVSYCKVYNYPYQGVYITTRRDMTSDHVLQYPQNIVEYCEFYPRTLITNGFAIEDYGNAPSIIRYNKIFGSGQYHGTGIHVTTKQVDVDSLQWSIVEGNVGTVESYPYNQEYPYGNLAYGFQHEGVPLCSLRTNYLTALAIDPAAPAVDGMRITRSGTFKLIMHDNTFRGFSTGNVTGAALHLYSPTWSFDPATDVFDCYHNDFISNGVTLRSVGVNSVGLQFKDCFFDFKDTLTAPNWKKMKSGENAYLPARDLRFIDNRYGDAEADSAFERTMMFGAYNYLTTADNGTEWYLSWTTTINSSQGGAPLEGDSVFIVSAQGDTLVRGATNVAGQLITVVDEFRDSAATTTYNQPVDRTQYNPYVLKVRHSGLELEQQVWIDGKKTINFNFSNDLSGLFKRKKRILE